MNRIKTLALALVSLIATSCIRDVYLEPFAFPDELNKEIYRVESFSDSTFFAATDNGIFYKHSDKTWYSVPYTEIGQSYSETDWADARIDHNNNSVFCGFGTHFLLVTENSTQTGEFQFMQKSTVTITPENEYLRVGYGLVTFENGENFERYYIYFEKLDGDSTIQIPTDMMVKSTELGNLEVTYDENGDMIIATNPVFRVSNWQQGNVQYEEIAPSSGITTYRSIASPNVVGEKLYGFDRSPNRTTPITLFYEFDLNTKEVTSAMVSLYCDADDNSLGPIKLLDWNGSEAILYHKIISTPASGTYENVGYIQHYNFETKSCELVPIVTTNSIKYSSVINDIGFKSGSPEILIGSSSQLYHYEIETDSVQPYAQTLLDL